MEFDFEIGKCFMCKEDCGASQACSSCMRKISLDEIYISVKPKCYSKRDSDEECAYCNITSPFIEGNLECGIRYCINHKSQAQLDMKSWLITTNSVFIKDIKIRYPELYRILENGIPLTRSTGSFDSDWKLDKTKGIITKDKNVGWIISFCKFNIGNQSTFYNKLIKHIPISMFINEPSYNVFFKSMIERLKRRLEKGFYNDTE
jgi:hypothetical protein